MKLKTPPPRLCLFVVGTNQGRGIKNHFRSCLVEVPDPELSYCYEHELYIAIVLERYYARKRDQ